MHSDSDPKVKPNKWRPLFVSHLTHFTFFIIIFSKKLLPELSLTINPAAGLSGFASAQYNEPVLTLGLLSVCINRIIALTLSFPFKIVATLLTLSPAAALLPCDTKRGKKAISTECLCLIADKKPATCPFCAAQFVNQAVLEIHQQRCPTTEEERRAGRGRGQGRGRSTGQVSNGRLCGVHCKAWTDFCLGVNSWAQPENTLKFKH